MNITEEEAKANSSKFWAFISIILFMAVVVLAYMIVQNKLQPQGQVIKEVIKEVPATIASYKVNGTVDSSLDALINDESAQVSEQEILLSHENLSLGS